MFLCSPSQADHAHRKVFPLSANRFPRLYLFGTFELDVLEAGSWQGTRRYEGGSKGLQHQKSQHATVAQAPCTAGSIDKCNIINALKSFSRFWGRRLQLRPMDTPALGCASSAHLVVIRFLANLVQA